MATEKKQEEILTQDLAEQALESLMSKLKAKKLWKCGTPELKSKMNKEQKDTPIQ